MIRNAHMTEFLQSSLLMPLVKRAIATMAKNPVQSLGCGVKNVFFFYKTSLQIGLRRVSWLT